MYDYERAVKTADLMTVNVAADFAYGYLADGDNLKYLGTWTFGKEQVESDTGIEGLNQIAVPKNADARVRKDITDANYTLVGVPKTAYAVFLAARQVTVTLAQQVQVLTGKAYAGEALTLGMKTWVDKAFTELDKQTAQLFASSMRVDDAVAAALLDFPATAENEFQSVLYDSAICARLAPLADTERQQIQQGTLPARFNDARVVQALTRCPEAMHGFNAAELHMVQEAFAQINRPHTMQACKVSAEMVQMARQVLAAAVVGLAPIAAIPAAVCFAAIRKGDWLAEIRHLIDTKAKQFDPLERMAASIR